MCTPTHNVKAHPPQRKTWWAVAPSGKKRTQKKNTKKGLRKVKGRPLRVPARRAVYLCCGNVNAQMITTATFIVELLLL